MLDWFKKAKKESDQQVLDKNREILKQDVGYYKERLSMFKDYALPKLSYIEQLREKIAKDRYNKDNAQFEKAIEKATAELGKYRNEMISIFIYEKNYHDFVNDTGGELTKEDIEKWKFEELVEMFERLINEIEELEKI